MASRQGRRVRRQPGHRAQRRHPQLQERRRPTPSPTSSCWPGRTARRTSTPATSGPTRTPARPTAATSNACWQDGWKCQHKWPEIMKMVAFRNTVARHRGHELVGQRQQRHRLRPRRQGLRGDQPRGLRRYPHLPDVPAGRQLLRRPERHLGDRRRLRAVHRIPRTEHRAGAPHRRAHLLTGPATSRPAAPAAAGRIRLRAPPRRSPRRDRPHPPQIRGQRGRGRTVRRARTRRGAARVRRAPAAAVRPGARRPARPARPTRASSSTSCCPTGSPTATAANDEGGLTGGRLTHRLRPHRQGLLPGRRPQGPDREARLHQGARHHRHLDGADLQEPARAGHRQGRLGRLPRLLDHRLHPGRPALRHQRRPEEADRRGPRQGHEGLLRRHHQPHRRRHRLRREQYGYLLQGRLSRTSTRTAAPSTTRLRRRQPGVPEGHRRLLPVHADRARARARSQGPGLAERPDDVPQPGRLHLRRRERRVRRLLRPRRPVDRAARGRPRHGADLRATGSRDFDIDGFRIDTVKHVDLAFWTAVGHRPRRYAARHGRQETSSCSARSTPPTRRSPRPYVTQGRLDATLDFPFQEAARAFASQSGPAKALSGVYAPGLPLHHRQGQRLRAGHLPRQPRHGPDRHRSSPQDNPKAGDAELLRRDRAGQRADVPQPRQPGRLLRRRAGLHRRRAATRTPGRRCSPRRSPTTSTTTRSAPTAPTRATRTTPTHPLYRAIAALPG